VNSSNGYAIFNKYFLFEFMASDNSEIISYSFDEEVGLRDVASFFIRRWIWVAGGGLLGLAIAGFSTMLRPAEKPLLKLRMVVDASQSPCAWTQRKFQKFEDESVFNIKCNGEIDASRKELISLANKYFSDGPRSGKFKAIIRPLEFESGRKNRPMVSKSQLELLIEASPEKYNYDNLFASLKNIKNDFRASRFNATNGLAPNLEAGEAWLTLESLPSYQKNKSYSRPMMLGLLSGFVLGSGAGLIVDRKTDRVFSEKRILEQLNYPLWISLPALPWSTQMVSPMIGQLAARLDTSLEWRVLSIAHENEVVEALAQALISQNEPGLSCKSVKPLFNSIVRLGSDERPIGLLIVVESGFNSSKALEEARLLLNQLPFVQSIGVVLGGVPLPSEMVMAEKA
jgi:hypothetical protein